MSGVEDEARRALRWFPMSWRESNGASLIGTLMDAADAEKRTHLTSAERRDLVASGLREQASHLIPKLSRDTGAAIALGIGAGLAAVQLVIVEWAPWIPSALRDLVAVQAGFGPFASAGAVVDILWIVAFVFGLLRLRGPMMVSLTLSIGCAAFLNVAPVTSWSAGRPTTTSLAIMGLLALTACAARPTLTPRFILRAGLGATMTAVVSTLLIWHQYPAWHSFGSRAFVVELNPWALGPAIFLILIVFVLTGHRTWVDAILLAAGPAWVLLFLGTLVANPHTSPLAVTLMIGAVFLLIITRRVKIHLSLD